MRTEDEDASVMQAARLDEPTARIVTKRSVRDHVTISVFAGGSAGAMHVLGVEETTIGRDADNTISLADVGVSGHHARIFRRGGQFVLEDLSSTNGTYLNGTQVLEPVELSDADRIALGQSTVLGVRHLDAVEVEAARQLYHSVVRDPLTGLFNRRHFEERLLAEWAFALRHGTALAVVMIDIDNFKRVNDTHGHLAGDVVLREIGASINETIRAEDVAARYGGEEFIVLCRDIDVSQAAAFAERLRRAISTRKASYEGLRLLVTASFGVAVSSGKTSTDPQELVARADAALYRAKLDGRDRVAIDS